MSLLSEFKNFAMKGNVVDLAVGVIIGGAFGKIVTSLVADVLMPILGLLVGGIDFSNLKLALKVAPDGKVLATLNYGLFIQSVFDFLVVAFAIFTAIKAMNTARKKEETEPSTPPPLSTQETLLTEIRDLLKNKP